MEHGQLVALTLFYSDLHYNVFCLFFLPASFFLLSGTSYVDASPGPVPRSFQPGGQQTQKGNQALCCEGSGLFAV